MHVFILTSNKHKESELSKYFHQVGLKTEHLFNSSSLPLDLTDYLCVQEQTKLTNKEQKDAQLDIFEEVLHHSEITLTGKIQNIPFSEKFSSEVEGYIFPNLKTQRHDVYHWDDVFVAKKNMKSYLEMKDLGLKNSARDLAFSQVIHYLPNLFSFEKKVNLNFNPVNINEVISFEPVIYNLCQENRYYKLAYENEVFHNILNFVLNDGLFVRLASSRQQKNYWLPGLNAGVPLTPKKDELHELTFLFHDIMHFLFPDLIVSENTTLAKHKYILARLMSEAFTLVLADMLFISLMKKAQIEYDYNKRKIFPLIEYLNLDVKIENLPKIKELLWANTQFAVLGKEKALKELCQNAENFEAYKNKYQRFFQEDFIWTNHNYSNMAKYAPKTKMWAKKLNKVLDLSLTSTFALTESNLEKEVKEIFDTMFNRLEKAINYQVPYQKDLAKSNAFKHYMAGQCYIFAKFDTSYNDLFFNQIATLLETPQLNEKEMYNIQVVFESFLTKLEGDHFINAYQKKNYQNIYPVFDAFYVFYDRQNSESFDYTLKTVFN